MGQAGGREASEEAVIHLALTLGPPGSVVVCEEGGWRSIGGISVPLASWER